MRDFISVKSDMYAYVRIHVFSQLSPLRNLYL